MAVLETAPVPPEVAPEPVTAPAERPLDAAAGGVRVAAFGLWGVVVSLLGYGILQTAVKAVALFG